MIRIIRPTTAPKGFREKGSAQKRKDCRDYGVSGKAYRSGKKKFDDKRTIYASKEVKEILSKAQHNKCCYCEKRFRAAINLAVEHFRPKSAVRQSRKLKEQCPGYYWLAYEWSNLLLSCQDCNSCWKGTLFPLANPKQRARTHLQNISIERPLLISPLTTPSPRNHIRFRLDDAEPHTVKGRITIDVLGLRRPALREDRLEKLDLLRRALELTKLAAARPRDRELQRLAHDAQEFLDAALLPQAEFSSMAQDFLESQARALP